LFKRKFLIFLLKISPFFLISAFFLLHPFFRIKTIKTENFSSLLKKYKGKNIFLISVKEIRKDLKSIPEIKEVKVSKKFPSTLEVHIEKRHPFLFFRRDKTWWGVDEEGVVFPSRPSSPSPLVIWKKDFSAGEKFSELSNGVKVFREFRHHFPQWEIRSLEIKETGIFLHTNRGITIIFSGEGNVSQQMARLKKIIDKVRPLSCIDLRFGEDVIVK